MGRFFVIDGTDGSGKGTQTRLIVERLRHQGYDVEMVDFPQYGTKSAGMVEEYLNGRYGSANEVSPYTASIFYACDRYDGSFRMRRWLDEGKIIIANRYVSSSMGHQGGKIKDPKERRRYIEWLDHLEFSVMGIPRPDQVILLYVPSKMGQKLVEQKDMRSYLENGPKDIHEKDSDHLSDAERSYLELCERYDDWSRIDCVEDGTLLTRKEINEKIWRALEPLL